MQSHITIVDYGINNIKSIQRAINEIGYDPNLASNPDQIKDAEKLILPGVGSFENGMNNLTNINGMIEAIHEFIKSGKPMIAICLGMQMLLDTSEENGLHKGLGIVSGSVKKIPSEKENGSIRKIPHVQWNKLKATPHLQSWKNTYLKDVKHDDYFYFIHSYVSIPNNKKFLIATSEYEGIELPAVINKENVTAFQFHPEKSGQSGLIILENFVNN